MERRSHPIQPRWIAGGALALACMLWTGIAGHAGGQCILANPSFEIDGSGGEVFGGWEQFGQVGSVTVASHGAQAARVSGPGGAGWDVSGYWQRLDSGPGEQWEATGHVLHPAMNPLTGACVALVNIEWRDGGGQLIDYDSFTVADPTTPTDAYVDFSVLSDPAPPGTAAIHYLLAVLQGPGDPSPDVIFDQVTIFSTSAPTMDEMQWIDFPGGRTLDFANRTWRVKGPGYYGPGPNTFCDDPECVWVDGSGLLHLTLAERSGTWASTEVALEEALGYGDYILTTVGRLDLLDIHAVLGIFLWQYGPCWDPAYFWWNPYNEIDIEYSRWGDPANDLAQFVVQPYDWPGNRERFDVTFAPGQVTSHAMRWLSDRIEYRVWRGGPSDESPETMIHAWTYSGPHIPRPEQPRLHLNLWKLEGTPAQNQEVVFQDFVFVPDDPFAGVEEHETWDRARPGPRLTLLGPSPFRSQTAIGFEMSRETFVELGVFSPDGRLVRTLARGRLSGGMHTVQWDGRDEMGRSVGSGVYLVRLWGADFLETRPAVLLR